MNDDKELQDIFEELPDAMVSRLISTDMVERVKKIGEAHKLPDDQIEILQTILSLVFLDKISFDDIDAEIDDDIDADDIQLAGLKKDIDEQIIAPFINELKENLNEASTATHPDRPTSRKPLGEEVSETQPKPANLPVASHEEAIMPLVVSQNVSTAATTPVVPVKPSVSVSVSIPATPVNPPIPPTPTKPSSETIIDSRLNNSASLPKEDIVIKEKTDVPQKKTYDGQDPYREPIE